MAKQFVLTPRQQRQLLFGIGGGIGFIAWVSLFLIPQQQALVVVQPQVKNLREQLKTTRQELAERSAMEARVAELSSTYGFPAVVPPPEQQLPDLLKAIGETARRHQVHFLAAKPKSDVNKLTPGPSGYLELPIFVVVSGGYHEMGTFVDALENSSHLLRVRELAIRGNPENPYHHVGGLLLQAHLVPTGERADDN